MTQLFANRSAETSETFGPLLGESTLGLSVYNMHASKKTFVPSQTVRTTWSINYNELSKLKEKFNNQISIVKNVIVSVKASLSHTRKETIKLLCDLSSLQLRLSSLFYQYNGHTEILNTMMDLLVNKFSQNIMTIENARNFIQNHDLLNIQFLQMT